MNMTDICPCDGEGVIEPESDPDEPRPRRRPPICRSCGTSWGRYVRPEYFPTATSDRQGAEQ